MQIDELTSRHKVVYGFKNLNKRALKSEWINNYDKKILRK